MQTLQLSTHIENNAQLNLTLPLEYANQDVELVLIIQPRKQLAKQESWQAFIDKTYGCLAEDPIERPEQPVMKEINGLL